MSKVEKPFILNYVDTQNALYNVVNNSKIPYVVLETIISSIHDSVKRMALTEVQRANYAYENSIKEENNDNGDEEVKDE